MWHRNNIGPNTVLWETPESTVISLNFSPSSTTRIFLLVRNDASQLCIGPLTPYSICFAYLWSFRWSNYIATLPRCFSFRLPHLNIPTGPPQTFTFAMYKLSKSCENVSFPASSNAYGAKIVRLSLCKETQTISLAGKNY